MGKNSGKRGERHIGFELLRIVSMFMIVLMHQIGHGGLGFSVEIGSVPYHIYWTIYALSKVSTNCFVMLTGYYMVKSKIKLSRIFKIWCEVLFYSVLTYFIAVKFGCAELSLGELLKVLTPISSGGYWFATGYILLYLCIPLLNRVINGIKSEKEYRVLLIGMLIVTSVMPTVFYWTDPAYINGGYSYIWFIVLYFVAAYIRIYDLKISKKTCLLIYLGLAATVSSTRVAAELLQAKIGATTLVDNLMDYKMPVTLVMSVMFFMLFKNMKVKGKLFGRAVCAVAPLSFGVYLLHDSPYTRVLLWKKVNMTRFDGAAASLLYMFAAAAVIMSVCYAVSFAYQKIYAVLHIDKAEKIIDGFQKKEGNFDEGEK